MEKLKNEAKNLLMETECYITHLSRTEATKKITQPAGLRQRNLEKIIKYVRGEWVNTMTTQISINVIKNI